MRTDYFNSKVRYLNSKESQNGIYVELPDLTKKKKKCPVKFKFQKKKMIFFSGSMCHEVFGTYLLNFTVYLKFKWKLDVLYFI